jgi:tRNA U55 pseudouridine synthase TruB
MQLLNQTSRYACIQKKIGETPLEAMEAWRLRTRLDPTIPLAYAGRLDPMASGTLLVLIGHECKKQTLYHNLDKEYEFEILLGISTDTGDVLGLGSKENVSRKPTSAYSRVEMQDVLRSMRGSHTFKYPRFSARTVRGIPLHEWTLRGGLDDSDIPTYTGVVQSIWCIDTYTLSASELKRQILEKINTIPPVTDLRKALGADFRRGEIIPRWHTLLGASTCVYTIVKARAIVSSGTYIRTLSEEYGKRLGIPALTFSIHRTTLGHYHSLPLGIGFWTKRM